MPLIPCTRSGERSIRHDKEHYQDRWHAEAAFCTLEDLSRVATRYDKPARDYASFLALAAVIALVLVQSRP